MRRNQVAALLVGLLAACGSAASTTTTSLHDTVTTTTADSQQVTTSTPDAEPAPSTTSTEMAPTTTSPGVATTAVVLFVPPTIPRAHRDGSCHGYSSVTPRPNAYRCTTGNEIHDPCFDTGTAVICRVDPFTDDAGFVLDLAEPLPDWPDPTGPQPWILEVEDDIRCWVAGGATGAVDGQRLHFGCSDGTWILEDLRPGTVWTGHRVEMSARFEDVVADFGFVPIVTVWH